MIDKPPKIEKKDDIGRSQSENIAKKEIDKIRKVLNGEADSSEVAGKEEIPPEPPEIEEEKDTAKPVKGGTWHDNYDNY